MSQYYESSKYISNPFFVMPCTYILDDSIKSPTLILAADHSTLLFLPSFFFLNKELLFSSVGEPLHEHGHIFAWPSTFNGPFFMTPPLSAVSKSCDPPSVSTPSPLLISDKSLRIPFTKTKFPVTKIALQDSVAQRSHFRISSTNPKVVKPFNFSKLALEAKRKGVNG